MKLDKDVRESYNDMDAKDINYKTVLVRINPDFPVQLISKAEDNKTDGKDIGTLYDKDIEHDLEDINNEKSNMISIYEAKIKVSIPLYEKLLEDGLVIEE